MEFKETMFMGEGEKPNNPEPIDPESSPLDSQILDITTQITETENFIHSLVEMQDKDANDRRRKDILEAKIKLAELQTAKAYLLDEKFKGIPAANDSVIDDNQNQLQA